MQIDYVRYLFTIHLPLFTRLGFDDENKQDISNPVFLLLAKTSFLDPRYRCDFLEEPTKVHIVHSLTEEGVAILTENSWTQSKIL